MTFWAVCLKVVLCSDFFTELMNSSSPKLSNLKQIYKQAYWIYGAIEMLYVGVCSSCDFWIQLYAHTFSSTLQLIWNKYVVCSHEITFPSQFPVAWQLGKVAKKCFLDIWSFFFICPLFSVFLRDVHSSLHFVKNLSPLIIWEKNRTLPDFQYCLSVAHIHGVFSTLTLGIFLY